MVTNAILFHRDQVRALLDIVRAVTSSACDYFFICPVLFLVGTGLEGLLLVDLKKSITGLKVTGLIKGEAFLSFLVEITLIDGSVVMGGALTAVLLKEVERLSFFSLIDQVNDTQYVKKIDTQLATKGKIKKCDAFFPFNCRVFQVGVVEVEKVSGCFGATFTIGDTLWIKCR